MSKSKNCTSIPFHNAKLTVWCGLTSKASIGPQIFEDPDTGSAVTVTKKRYVDILMEVLPEDFEYVQSFIFIQDETPAYTSRLTLDLDGDDVLG